jgi:hypothetical protein
MFAPIQECEQSSICVRHIDLILGFGSVPTVWYFCVLRNLCNYNTHVSVEFASYSFCGSWIMLLWFVECNTGYYGPRCLTKCGKCEGNNCSRINGDCTNCLPGWIGRRCDKRNLVVHRTSCTLSIVYSLWTVSWLIPYFKTCYYRECVNMCLPLSWKVLSHVFENRNLDSENLTIGYSTLRSISTWNSIK